MKDIQALLFDLGGVVIKIDFRRAFAHWAQFTGCAEEHFARRFDFDQAYERLERGEIPPSEYFASLRRKFSIDLPDDQFEQGWNAIFIGLMPGIEETLKSLAGKIPLYIFSNSNIVHEQHWKQHYCNVLRHFDVIFVSSTIGHRKPEASAFDYVVQQIGIERTHIAFFDDLAENTDAARKCQLQAFHVPTPSDLNAALNLAKITG